MLAATATANLWLGATAMFVAPLLIWFILTQILHLFLPRRLAYWLGMMVTPFIIYYGLSWVLHP